MLQTRRPKRRAGEARVATRAALLLSAILCTYDLSEAASIAGTYEVLDPEIHVTRALLINRGLKNRQRLLLSETGRTADVALTGLQHAHSQTATEPALASEAATAATVTDQIVQIDVVHAEASAGQQALRGHEHNSSEMASGSQSMPTSTPDGTTGEPEEWIAHFQRRRLMQGSGDDLALSPGGAPVVRRARRDIVTGSQAPAGSVGVSSTLSAESETSSQSVEANASAGLFTQSIGAPPVRGMQQPVCATLAYRGGYASFKATPYATFRFTSNKDECCELCDEDDECAAWMRIAGGQSSVRTCYLINSANASFPTASPSPLTAPVASGTVQTQSLSPAPAVAPSADDRVFSDRRTSPAASEGAAPGPDGGRNAVAVSTVRFTAATSPLIVESGTKTGTELPREFYGCPYPISDSGSCVPPEYCNCNAGVCYGSCEGDELMDSTPSASVAEAPL